MPAREVEWEKTIADAQNSVSQEVASIDEAKKPTAPEQHGHTPVEHRSSQAGHGPEHDGLDHGQKDTDKKDDNEKKGAGKKDDKDKKGDKDKKDAKDKAAAEAKVAAKAAADAKVESDVESAAKAEALVAVTCL